MTKSYHNLKVTLFILFYIVVNLAFLPIGRFIADFSFAFGMTQFTILATMVSLRYEMFEVEGMKFASKPKMHILLILMSCVLFSIVAMISYLRVMDSSLLISIHPLSLPTNLFILQAMMILISLPANDIFFIKLMQSFKFKMNERRRLLIGILIFMIIRMILFYFMNPRSLIVTFSYSMITGFCAALLILKNHSLMVYPIGVLIIGIIFSFL